MSSQWADVDALIHDLGAVRTASLATRGESATRPTIDEALLEATNAVLRSFEAPEDPGVIARAHEAIEAAAQILASQDEELVTTLRVRDRAGESGRL